MHDFMTWVMDAFHQLVAAIDALGYPGILILMAMESSVLPVPSELVMPPAGYLAHQGQMSATLAILCGTVGSLIGAYANYFVSRWLGRPLVLKYGKYVLISEKKFIRAEAFFLKHGEVATFIGRLLPVIRHLISIPAGLAGMNHLRFSLYTLLGAAIWCTVLTCFGYFIGAEQEVIKAHFSKVIIGAAVFCAAVLAVYVWWLRRRRCAGPAADGSTDGKPA
ncbi:MAG TPA: DedA family protein [Planctomycetota bacterium]|nr:DedA family protein [Planctomycetota bacterium]